MSTNELFNRINAGVSFNNAINTQTRESVGGQHNGRGMHIYWHGKGNPTGAAPINVLVATAQRMEHLQTTTSASDVNAKALFKVLEAIDILAGTNEVTGDPLDASQLGGAGFVSPPSE